MLHPRRVILILAALLSINALLPARFAFGLGNFLQPMTQLLVAPGRPIYHALGGTGEQIDETQNEFAGMDAASLEAQLAWARTEAERLRQQNQRLSDSLAE